MNVKFKIYFKDKELEKKVLVHGLFSNYQWSKLRDAIIQNSQRGDFSSLKKELKDSDDFILEIQELPKDFNFPLKKIWNIKTYNYFLDNLKIYKEKNPQNDLKLIKLYVVKVDTLPSWELPKYDIILKNILENTWNKEIEILKKELNDNELKKGIIGFVKRKSENVNNDSLKQYINNNIICNSCLSINFFGYRYVCAYCNNFNLCQKCFNLGNHTPEHNFLLFKNPINEDDSIKYNNKFSPSTVVFKNENESFEVNVKIANTGEKDLKNCYIAYIKFSGNYLWCKKLIINEKFAKNENKNIQLTINFEDKEDKNGIFEGHFRMFTEKGVPFGDILKIRVKNDKM